MRWPWSWSHGGTFPRQQVGTTSRGEEICLFCHEIQQFLNPELEPRPAPTLMSSSRQNWSLRPAKSQPEASQQVSRHPRLELRSLVPWLGLWWGGGGDKSPDSPPAASCSPAKCWGTVSLKSLSFLLPLSPPPTCLLPSPHQKDFPVPLGTSEWSPWGGLRG